MDVSYASDSTEAPGDDERRSHHMPLLMLPYIDMASFDQEELGKLARCDSRHIQERCFRKYKVPIPQIDREVFSESLSSKLQGYRAVLLDKMEEEEGEGGSSSSRNEENDEDFSLGSRSGRGRARKRIARSLQGEPPKKVQRADRKAVNAVGASSSALAGTNVEVYVNVHNKSEGKLKAKVDSEEEEEARIVIGHELGKVDHKGRHLSPAGKSLSSFMEASTLPAHIVGAENFGCSPLNSPPIGKTLNSFSLNVQSTSDIDFIKVQQSSPPLEKSAKRLKTVKVSGRSSSGGRKTVPTRNEAGLFECLICHKTYLEVSRYWGHLSSHNKRQETVLSSQRRVSAKHIATLMQDVLQVTHANTRDVVFSNHQQPPPPPQHSVNEKGIFSNQHQLSAPLEQIFSNQQQASSSLQHDKSRDIEDKACGTGAGNTQLSPREVGSFQCPTCPKSYNNIARYYGHLSCHAKRRKALLPSKGADNDTITNAKDGLLVGKDHPRVPDIANEQPTLAIQKRGKRLLSRKTCGSDVGKPKPKPKPKPHIVPNKDGMFQCLICQKSYSELSRYYGHMSCHRVKKTSLVPGKKARKNVSVHPKSDTAVAKAELKESKSAEEQQIPLQHNAKESIIEKSSGNSVHRAFNIVGEDGPLQCPICQKSFCEASRYYSHISSHEKGRKRAAAEKKMTMKKIKVPSLSCRVKDSIAKVLEVSDTLQASPLLRGSGRNSDTNKVSENEMEKGCTISKGNGILQCLSCRKVLDDVSRLSGYLACHKQGHKTTSGQRKGSTRNDTTPALSPGFDDLSQPIPAAEVDQLGNVHDETADIVVASTSALSGSNISGAVGEIGQLDIQVDHQGLHDTTIAPMNIFQTSLHVGVDSHKITCSLTSKMLPDTKPEAASISSNHYNGFLKLLGKSTQNEGGGNILSQNGALVENLTKPHYDMNIGGQLVSKIQVQGPAVHKDTGCWQCGEPFQNVADLLFCDWCDREFHAKCVLVGLQPLPQTNWVCPFCEGGS